MEKKRGHLLIDELIRMSGLTFVLFVAFLLWFSQDVRADLIPGGEVKTSYLKEKGYTGKDLDMNQDVTIVVDADFSAGKLYTGKKNLTIEGDGNATLTLQELSTATSSDGGSIAIKSGNVHVNCTTSTTSFQAAVYCVKRFTISGGELTITNKIREHGLSCEILNISGGKLKIAMNKGKGSSITGISIAKDGAFSMSGGELYINVSGENTGATMNGLYLNTGCKGVITGGHTSISAAFTTGTGYNIRGIGGSSDASLLISGGSVTAQGYSAGIATVPLEICGDALVTAKGNKEKNSTSVGIYVNQLKLSGRPIVRAEGGKSAISAASMDALPKTLVITTPKGGTISKTGSPERYAVVTSVGPPSPTVEIDYVDNPGTVTVEATPSELVKGTAAKVTCKATMSGYAHDVGFTWSLSGNKSASTKIDAGGVLHIAADETSDKLIVTAATKADKSIYGSAEITLIEKPGKVKAETEKETEKESETIQLKKEKKEKITIGKRPSSVKAKAKKRKVTVTWKRIKKNKAGRKLLKQIKSIQVQYSTDKTFKQNVKTKSVGKKKTKVKLKLKKKTTYYIRVRYKGSNGFSKWSKVKKVKTKR